jgi:imidazolonepropionase
VAVDHRGGRIDGFRGDIGQVPDLATLPILRIGFVASIGWNARRLWAISKWSNERNAPRAEIDLMWDSIWVNANLATMAGAEPYGAIRNGVIAVEGGSIAFVGARTSLPSDVSALAGAVHDAGGAWMTPGLVDSHTHVIYGGDSRRDFVMRLRGATREEIYGSGGGVPGVVMATRQASDDELFQSAARRILELQAHGVTTLESKSGFGLDRANELRQMRLSRELGKALPVTVVSTFLGAHGLAPEYAGRPDDYINFLGDTVLPEAVREGVVDAVDGFCDKVGFSHTQIGRLFERARSFGLPVRLHADQYSDYSAGALAAKHKALCADHLEYASEPTVAAMAEAGTIAGLLPGANYTLRETVRPPIDLFRRYGVPMAVATNSNPGSSPTNSPPMIMNLACTLFRTTPEEALAGFTVNGARALGIERTHGTLEVGKVADLAIWDISDPVELSYLLAANRCVAVIKAGDLVHQVARPKPVRWPGSVGSIRAEGPHER